ncbi:MAG: hypothetical protein ABUK13_07700 [Gammaproteobacteria bacterium]
MIFTADEEQTVTRGTYNYVAAPGTGSITLNYAPAGVMTLVNSNGIVNGVVTAADTDLIVLPTCRFKAGLTGDATFELYKA